MGRIFNEVTAYGHKSMKMEKKIEDFLPYYIGQEIEFNGERITFRYFDWLLDQVGMDREDGGVEIAATKEIKLRLRPLSSMTIEEEEVVAGYCLDDEDFICTYRGMGYENDGMKIHESVKCVKIETYCEHPEINNWIPSALLQIDYESDKSPIIISRFEDMGKVLKDDMIEKPFDLTHYLLKQGFDLFGLIEMGLAVDKTKEVGK